MSDRIDISQRAGMGSDVTQIGTQINYQGLSVDDAYSMAMRLFEDNFPRLQEQALKVARERVDEMMQSVFKTLADKKITDLSGVADPDVQFVLYEAQKSYARFGEKERLSLLSELIASRITEHLADLSLKVSIDKAIQVGALLNKRHLDFLALLFVVTQTKFSEIRSVEDLQKHLDELNSIFPSVDKNVVPFLLQQDCLHLMLTDVPKRYASLYGIPVEQVKGICPPNILGLTGDYSTSQVGTVLAVAHLKQCTGWSFDLKRWVHD